MDRFGNNLFRPAIAYISAVSITLMPRSIPNRSAATSLARALLLSPILQVPWPRAGTRSPSGNETVFMYYFNRIWQPGKQEKLSGTRRILRALQLRETRGEDPAEFGTCQAV